LGLGITVYKFKIASINIFEYLTRLNDGKQIFVMISKFRMNINIIKNLYASSF